MRRLTTNGMRWIAMDVRFRLLTLGMLVALSMLPAHHAQAICASVLRDGDFEIQPRATVSAPWVAEGQAGIDLRRGLSARGRNNAWARNTTGWNGIRQPVRLHAGVPYTLKALVRASGNVRDGYFGFRDARQRPLSEIRFGGLGTYQELRVSFRPGRTGDYNVFAGFWAPNQDAWIQVDTVRVEFPCEDVILNPVQD